MQIFLILAFSIAVLFSDDKLLFKGLVDNNYTLIKENLNKERKWRRKSNEKLS